ncbi:copper resistance protein CopC [Cryobacterium algoricola]|uniref:Copper resistance protein CopC n=1 Tax=Cryobacterium algoricola TaxID=1259183 RepID=A0ABY2IDV1_9MICO|nr:copper resistance CopC family protein [Cryobacterium algoricola]TFB86218.1 copper resistance protein CopC [Cryobacterium algoricola]
MRRNHVRDWSLRALGVAAVVAAALGFSAAPASAHNYPVGYAPAENSVVTEQPGHFTVTTNDTLLNLDGTGTGNAMRISGPTDAPLYYGDGCITLFGAKLETTAQLGQPGEYTVTWQVVSTDGHPVSGSYTFTWQPAAGQVLAPGLAAAPTCGTTTPTDTPAASAPSGAAQGAVAPTDLLWIGGAAAAVIVAVAATLLLTRRRPTP